MHVSKSMVRSHRFYCHLEQVLFIKCKPLVRWRDISTWFPCMCSCVCVCMWPHVPRKWKPNYCWMHLKSKLYTFGKVKNAFVFQCTTHIHSICGSMFICLDHVTPYQINVYIWILCLRVMHKIITTMPEDMLHEHRFKLPKD